MVAFSNGPLWACGGTPVPPCGRSVFLAKFTPGVVVFPGGGGAITVPIGVLPFANWNNFGFPAPICPQPVAANLTLTLTCFPSGVVIGPQAFAVPVPGVPGPQPVPGGVVPFVIPAGVFPAGSPPQICLVVGTYSVTFTDGMTLAFTGDTEVCIVDPSPLDPAEPRLDMQYIPTGADSLGYKTCRKGDQADFYFLVANNDPNESVSLDLSSIGRQVSQLPDGFTPQNAYANDVYAISMPAPDTDTYPAAFTDTLRPGQLLPESDPLTPDPQALDRSFVLQPLEATIIGITMRSFGMCVNGSCNERLVKVEGTFSGGDPALACASTLLIVGDAPPKTPLCEFADSVKVSDFGDAIWSQGDFIGMSGPIPHAQTLFAGNVSPDSNFTGFITRGDSLGSPFSATGSDYIRLDQEAGGMLYNVQFESPFCGQASANFVNIIGLNATTLPSIMVPVIFHPNAMEGLSIQYDVANDQLNIANSLMGVYNGPAMSFFQNPPAPFCVDPGICRIITKRFDLSAKTIHVQPFANAHYFQVVDPDCDTFMVFNQANMPADWTGTVSGSGVMLPAVSGMGMIEACYNNLTLLPRVPETNIVFLNIECIGAINNPVRVPIAIRTGLTLATDPPFENQSVALHPAYPNPFTSTTTLSYTLKKTTPISMKIYNHLGQEVQTLVPLEQGFPGDHSVTWDGTDVSGDRVSPGFYFCKMVAGGVVRVQKLVCVD